MNINELCRRRCVGVQLTSVQWSMVLQSAVLRWQRERVVSQQSTTDIQASISACRQTVISTISVVHIRWQKLEITSQQRTDLNLDSLNKNLSELSAVRQGILNRHNDFVYNYWIDGSWKWFNLAELAARTGVNSDHKGVVFTKLNYRFILFYVFFLRYSVFFWYLE